MLTAPLARLAQTARAAGVNRAVAYNTLNQAVTLAVRPVTLVLIATCLTPEEQGFQYTLFALAGLRAFFALGLGPAATQFMARQTGRLTLSGRDGVSGDPEAAARLASLYRQSLLACVGFGVLFAVVVLPLGWKGLAADPAAGAVNWRGPWLVLGLLTAAAMSAEMVLAALIACGFIDRVARVRLVGELVQAAVYWPLLAGGAALYSAPLGAAAVMTLQLGWAWAGYRGLLRDLWRRPAGDNGVDWRHEVWPFQWRVAVNWGCAYLLGQAVVVLVFRVGGAADAGQFGLTLAVAALAQTMAAGMVHVRGPELARLVGLGDGTGRRRVYGLAVRLAAATFAGLAVAGLVGIAGLGEVWPRLASRFLSVGLAGGLFVAAAANLTLDVLSAYTHAFQKDPLVGVRVLAAVATAGLGFACGRAFGVPGVVAVMAGVGAVSVAVAVGVVRRFLRHSDADG